MQKASKESTTKSQISLKNGIDLGGRSCLNAFQQEARNSIHRHFDLASKLLCLLEARSVFGRVFSVHGDFVTEPRGLRSIFHALLNVSVMCE